MNDKPKVPQSSPAILPAGSEAVLWTLQHGQERHPFVTFRPATSDDCPLLAEFNHQLITDVGLPNRMTVAEMERRMRDWLAGEYRAIIFNDIKEILAYALYCEQPEEIYLRQFFVVRHRRRQGFGRRAVQVLRSEVWPKSKRLRVAALVSNTGGVAFWQAVGYSDSGLQLEILSE